MISITLDEFENKMNSLFEDFFLNLIDISSDDKLKMKQKWESEDMQTKFKSALGDLESEKIDTAPFITITPINLKRPSTVKGKKAKIDYEREQKESNRFREACKWDDTSTNNSKVGQIFGFVHQIHDVNRIQIHTIIDIKNNKERIHEWDIEPHKIRNVLHLSPMIDELPWTKFINKYLPTWKKECDHILRGTKRCITTYKK